MIKFAQRLKELRIDKHSTQAELAEKLSVDQRTVSNWERGLNEPDYKTLALIAKTFDVTTDYLLGLSDY